MDTRNTLYPVLVWALFAGIACSQNPGQQVASAEDSNITKQALVKAGVDQLLNIQNEDGAWPYEGVYRVNREIPFGYRTGGTAICCEALLYSTAADHKLANRAIKRGVELIIAELEHPLMKASQESRYDVRVWGHIYALDLFCRIKATNRFPDLDRKIEASINKLTEALLLEEIDGGGWNYANRRSHAGFVTAPAVQALLWARQCGQEIPREMFQRAAEALYRSRNRQVAFAYSGDEKPNQPSLIQSSIARSAVCESTLELLGESRVNAIQHSIDQFHEHWDELEKRRKKTGTHKPPFGIAPYYFYYGHRYLAQAIQFLPPNQQRSEFERLQDVIRRTRDEDGTWNDRVFDRSKAYGTAMVVLALLEDKVPNPASLRQRTVNLDAEDSDRLADIYLYIDPKMAIPDLNIMLNAELIVTIDSELIGLVDLEAWLKKKRFLPKPSIVQIDVDGSVKNSEVQRLKKVLSDQFGDVGLYVGILD